MNVLISALSAPSQLNGVSRHGANLVRALLSTSEISTIHFLGGSWQRVMFDDVLPEDGSRLHKHWINLSDANFHRLLWYLRELPRIAGQLRADLVHLTYPVPIAKESYPCPTILSLHDLYPFTIPQNFGRLGGLLARRTVKQCLSGVGAIACASESTRSQLAALLPLHARKATVVPNVVEMLPPASIDGVPESLKSRAFVLCIAQHRANKKVPLTIEIFARALERRVLPADAELVIVGIAGPETREIHRQMSQSQLANKVLLLSGLPDAALRWCYENCALLLAPSSEEGFGLPLAEGTLAGCRIVCSDIPAFRETGGPTCRYVPWGEGLLDRYARAIRDVLARPKPSGRVLPQYSCRSIGSRYCALYDDLVCSRLPDFGMLPQPATEPRH